MALRAVKPGESAPPKKPLTLTQAADAGATRDMLSAMRGRIAKSIEDPNCSTRDLASLSKRLMEIQRDIDALDAQEQQEGSGSAKDTPDAKFDASAI